MNTWLFGWFHWLVERFRTTHPDPYGTRYQTIVVPRLGKMNRNGRIYTREMAQKMCGQLSPNAIGEIGMPEASDVSMKRASHRIHNIFIVDNDLWAEYSVLDTPCGRLLYDFFQKEGKEAFVLRPSGHGVVRDGGHIEDGYQLATFNFIPVHEDAFRPYTEEETLQCGLDTFGDKWAFYRWMDQPSEIHENTTPRQLMAEGRYDDVVMELGRIQHGIY
jgi:hypothetical protein